MSAAVTVQRRAYVRSDYPRAERLARAGLERATGSEEAWYCLLPLSVAVLARGAGATGV